MHESPPNFTLYTIVGILYMFENAKLKMLPTMNKKV